MIKGITLVRRTTDSTAFDQLAKFFSAMGFELGKGWHEPSSRSAPFLAPLANLEFVDGELPVTSEILVEVTSIDSVHEIAAKWIVNEFGEEALAQRLTPISETHWKSRSFTVEPAPGYSFAFWEWSEPSRGKPVAIEGDLSATGMRFAIVVARWNAVITDRLLQGALDALVRSGAHRKDIEVLRVPGSWEIPSAALLAAESLNYDAIITLGCLIRGETAHYEAIYNEVARGIGQSQHSTGVPHSFGVLTCETLEQALDRAGLKAGNKGFEAAVAAIEMVSLHQKFEGQHAVQP